MAALTSNWNCDNCGEENRINDPNCKICDEPKEGVMRASIPKIISIIKGLNLQSMLDSKTTRQRFSNEVYLAETNPDVAGLTHPREDLNESSVHDLAKAKQDELDYFARSFMGYIMQKIEISKIQATHIGNMRSLRHAENIVKTKFSDENMQLQAINAATIATLTDDWKYGNLESRNDLLKRTKIKVKEEQRSQLKKLEEEITKAQILLTASHKKYTDELKIQQEVKNGISNEIFQHMKEANVPSYTKKDAENLFDEYIDIYEKIKPKKEEILLWTDTLQSLINLCEGLEIRENEDIMFMLAQEQEEVSTDAQNQLLEEYSKKEKEKQKKREKKKRQKQNKRTRKKKEAEQAAKKAELEALRLRAEELKIQEKEEAAVSAKPKDEGMSKKEEVPLSSLDEHLISRITELYEYLQTQDIFKSERIKRDARMKLAKPYQEKMLEYILSELIPRLETQGIGLVVTGGFATHLLSNGYYDTEDIDIKVYNISMLGSQVSNMRQIVKRVIRQSLKSDKFKIFDPIEIEWSRDAPKAAEMVNNGNIPLKITARINIGEYRNDRNPTEYDAISEITYNVGMLYKDVKKQYVEDIPIQDQVSLIDNLLNHATINFKQRMLEGERNIYPEKILGWFKQLQELLRQTTKSNAVEVMNKTLSRVKQPSPKQGGKRKTRKRRKKRKTRKRKKTRKKRTRRK